MKQSLIAPGAQPAFQSQSDSKRGEICNLQGIPMAQFSSLRPYSLQPKGTENILDDVLCILGAQHEHMGVGK